MIITSSFESVCVSLRAARLPLFCSQITSTSYS